MKSILRLLLTLVTVVLIVLTGCGDKNDSSTLKEDFEKNAAIIENKLEEMGEEFDGKATTSVTPTTYKNSDGEVVMTYYFLKTEYEGNVPEISGLNTNAIKCVISESRASEMHECKVGDYPAVIYETSESNYLCWTISDEVSCVIKYAASVLSEEEIFKVAESVE